MKEMKLTIPGEPVGKGRPRITKYGTYTPKKTRDYELKVKDCWRRQSGQKFADKAPLLATLTAYFPIPKSTPKKKAASMEGTFHVSRPDCDNIAKAVLDSLNGLAYHDDSAVQITRCWKVYTSREPRVEVTITEADPPAGEQMTIY